MPSSKLQLARTSKAILSTHRTLPLLLATRQGSTHAHASHGDYGPEYESREGFRHPFFIWSGISLIGLAFYHNYVPTDDGQKPWLTRYMTENFFSNAEEFKENAAHNLSVILDSAKLASFKASVERPAIRRLANAGNFTICSPFGVVPGTQTDLSDLRIKSYRDDQKKPELPQESIEDKE